MNLQTIINKLELTVLTEPRDFASITPKGGYTSDLLSCVMAGAKSNNIWVTLQAHMNIIAVAACSMLPLSSSPKTPSPNQTSSPKPTSKMSSCSPHQNSVMKFAASYGN
jgi:hypothetical protein